MGCPRCRKIQGKPEETDSDDLCAECFEAQLVEDSRKRRDLAPDGTAPPPPTIPIGDCIMFKVDSTGGGDAPVEDHGDVVSPINSPSSYVSKGCIPPGRLKPMQKFRVPCYYRDGRVTYDTCEKCEGQVSVRLYDTISFLGPRECICAGCGRKWDISSTLISFVEPVEMVPAADPTLVDLPAQYTFGNVIERLNRIEKELSRLSADLLELVRRLESLEKWADREAK